MNNGKLIVVRHEYNETRPNPREKGLPDRTERYSDAWWAVEEPHTYNWDDPSDRTPYDFTTENYAILGGQPVRIYNQECIDGLRKLLDAIEADLKGGEEV